jgi:hypothetical protein
MKLINLIHGRDSNILFFYQDSFIYGQIIKLLLVLVKWQTTTVYRIYEDNLSQMKIQIMD